MFERFTQDARETVIRARVNAQRSRYGRIGTEHILLALLDRPETAPARLLAAHGLDRPRAEAALERGHAGSSRGDDLDADALRAIGIDLGAVRERVEAAFGPGALDRAPTRCRRGGVVSATHIPFTPRAKKALELSLREAVRLKHKQIGDEHILLGLLRERDGRAARIVADAGVDVAELRGELEALGPSRPADR